MPVLEPLSTPVNLCQWDVLDRRGKRDKREYNWTLLPHHRRRGQSEPTYDFAQHVVEMLSARRARALASNLEQFFQEEANRWKQDTRHCSSITKMVAHPSYLRIIGLSGHSTERKIERLILRELESDPDYWFAALTAITGEDPVRPDDDFDAAVNAWLNWGRENGVL